MDRVRVKEWELAEEDLIRLFRMFMPYRKKYGLFLGFEKFYEDHIDLCLGSGLDAVETILLHEWKGKYRYQNGRKYRHIKREHTDAEWQKKLEELDYRCVYCHCHLVKPTKDHIKPFSKGGSDKIENIAPACWSCNLSKRAKDVREWQTQCENA